MTTTSAWAHLPNAKHINWVLDSIKTNPGAWNAARYAAWEAAWEAGRYAIARTEAWQAAWEAVWRTAGAVDAARYAASDAASDAAWEAAWYACAALIAWDDCAYMLESDPGELKILAAFGDPRAILLLPACLAFNSCSLTTIAV